MSFSVAIAMSVMSVPVYAQEFSEPVLENEDKVVLPAEQEEVPQLTTEVPQEVVEIRDGVQDTPDILVPTASVEEEIDVVLVEDSLLVRTLASSSLNTDLPFTLSSEDMNFAINEVPSFYFSHKDREDSSAINGFVLDIVDSIGEKVEWLYEGSFVETIVNSVTETFSDVVDFLVPTAEGQEPEESLVPVSDIPQSISEESPVEEEDTVVQTPLTEEEVAEDATSTPIQEEEIVLPNTEPVVVDSADQDTDIVVEGDLESISKALSKDATSTVMLEAEIEIIKATPVSFALVDGTRVPIEVLSDTEEGFTVTFVDGIFGVGEHALELHIVLDGTTYTAYYIFTIEGTVVSLMPLTDTEFAVIVADIFGMQTLWLEEMASGTVRSFEKLADETIMAKNPVLEFKVGVLFWTMPNGEALIGFDMVSKSTFSQTLNTQSGQENVLELQSGDYEVQVDTDAIQVEFIPPNIRI